MLLLQTMQFCTPYYQSKNRSNYVVSLITLCQLYQHHDFLVNGKIVKVIKTEVLWQLHTFCNHTFPFCPSRNILQLENRYIYAYNINMCDWILENQSNCRFINTTNTNYKYSIQYISGYFHATLHISTVIQGTSVYQLLNG